MKKITVMLIIFFLIHYSQLPIFAENNLMLFCGAAFKKPIGELTGIFMEKNNIKVNVNYNCMSALYAQISFSRKGDLFIVPSPDLMEKANKNKMIHSGSVKNFAYIVPVINVKKGNPKNIKLLTDFTNPGIRIAIANPKTVFIGMLAIEIFEKELNNFQRAAVKKNISVHAEDFSKLAFLLIVEQVDAIVGLHYLSELFPDKISTIKLNSNEIHRMGSGQAAILSYSKNIKSARKFIDFITSETGKEVFKKYHYFGTKEEADSWIGAEKPVGGEYFIPKTWFDN